MKWDVDVPQAAVPVGNVDVAGTWVWPAVVNEPQFAVSVGSAYASTGGP